MSTATKVSKANFLRSLADGLDEGMPEPISTTLYMSIPKFLVKNRADWEAWVGYFGGRPDEAESHHSEQQEATFTNWTNGAVVIERLEYDKADAR